VVLEIPYIANNVPRGIILLDLIILNVFHVHWEHIMIYWDLEHVTHVLLEHILSELE
jgi:hypothetical protein